MMAMTTSNSIKVKAARGENLGAPHRPSPENRRCGLLTIESCSSILFNWQVVVSARNIFSRITGEREPHEWQWLEADFDGRLYVDPMNWDILRRESNTLLAKYSWKAAVGTFDTAIVASVKLAGGTRFLSFDQMARAMAAAEGIGLFPPPDAAERRVISRLKHRPAAP